MKNALFVSAGLVALWYAAVSADTRTGVIATLQDAAKSTPATSPATGPARVDHYGDPLPPGALARLGSIRLGAAPTVTVAAFIGNGLLATSSYNEPISFWDIKTMDQVRTIDSGGILLHLIASADGKTVVTSGAGGLKVWRSDKAKDPEVIKAGEGRLDVRISADGKTIAAAECSQGKCQVERWNGADLSAVETPAIQMPASEDLAKTLQRMVLSDDLGRVAILTLDGSATLFDVATGKYLCKISPTQKILLSTFTPDGATYLTSGTDGVMQSWDVKTAKPVMKFEDKVPLSPAVQLVFMPGGGEFLTVQGGKIRRWDFKSGKGVSLDWAPEKVSRISLSPDGKTLAAVTAAAKISLHDLASGRNLIAGLSRHDGAIVSVALSPDGKYACTFGVDKTVRLWDASSGEHLALLGTMASAEGGVAFSHDSKVVAACAEGDEVRQWDTATRALLKDRIVTVPGGATALQCSADDQSLLLAARGMRAMGFADGGTKIVDARTGKGLRSLPPGAKPGPDNIVQFLGGGSNLLVAASSPRIIDATSGETLLSLVVRNEICLSADSSGDGRVVATSSDDRMVRLWEVLGGKCVLSYEAVPNDAARFNRVRAVAVSPDGTMLASTPAVRKGDRNEDHWISLCDTVTGQTLVRFEGHRGMTGAQCLAFSADGTKLVSGGDDGMGYVWDLSAAHKVVAAAAQERMAKLKDLSPLVEDLASEDAAKAYRAVMDLSSKGDEAVKLLDAKLAPEKGMDPDQVKQIKQWIADLDSDTFATRDKAYKSLAKLDASARAIFEEALKQNPSAEVKNSLTTLLNEIKEPVAGKGKLGDLRGVWVLQRVGSAKAREVLRRLAGRAATSPLTKAAKDSLQALPRGPSN